MKYIRKFNESNNQLIDASDARVVINKYSRDLLEIKDPTDLKFIKDKNYGYVKENFDPTSDIDSKYLYTKKDLEDEGVVKQYIELNGLDPLVLDIWRYGKRTLNEIPLKITPRGIRYSPTKSKGYVEIEFTTPKFTLYKTTVSVGSKRGQINYHLKGKVPFSYLKFKEFMGVSEDTI